MYTGRFYITSYNYESGCTRFVLVVNINLFKRNLSRKRKRTDHRIKKKLKCN